MHIKKLVLYTDLPTLWDIYLHIVALSPLDSNGYLTLSMANSYLDGKEIPCTHQEFWKAMAYFLTRQNQAIKAKRDSNKKKGK